MTRARWIFVAAAPVLAALLAWAFAGLPDFGSQVPQLGRDILRDAIAHTHATNAVTAVNFDYRAIDTLVEEMILFAATAGVTMLLRRQRDEEEGTPAAALAERRAPRPSNAIRTLGLALAGPIVAAGLYTVSWSDVTPGGGFQGGAVLASGLFVVFLASEYATMRRLRPVRLMELTEALGAGAFALLGVLGLILAEGFFANYLPRGAVGDILSGGVMLPENVAVLLAVAGALSLIGSEFLEQAIVLREVR